MPNNGMPNDYDKWKTRAPEDERRRRYDDEDDDEEEKPLCGMCGMSGSRCRCDADHDRDR